MYYKKCYEFVTLFVIKSITFFVYTFFVTIFKEEAFWAINQKLGGREYCSVRVFY